MKKITDHPLYVAAFAIGGAATLVGAVSVGSDLQSTGMPQGGSALTLLLGVTILALAVTGPSDPDDRPPSGDDGPAGSRLEDEEAP